MPTLVHQDIPRQDWMTDNIYDWAQAEESARCNTQLRLTLGYDHALIAIKAQHPLSANGTPNGEYTARLREALKIKSELESHGTTVTLMTFGGIHAGCTTISLAEAGATWLITHGVHPDHIITQPAVYSGTDEDDLAAQEFASHPRYRELHVILSAGQWERTRLYFIATG